MSYYLLHKHIHTRLQPSCNVIISQNAVTPVESVVILLVITEKQMQGKAASAVIGSAGWQENRYNISLNQCEVTSRNQHIRNVTTFKFQRSSLAPHSVPSPLRHDAHTVGCGRYNDGRQLHLRYKMVAERKTQYELFLQQAQAHAPKSTPHDQRSHHVILE